MDADIEVAERERALNASIIESLQEGLIVVDMTGRVTRANQAAAELCGVSLGELVGAQLRDLPLDAEPVLRALAGERVRGVQTQIRSLWIEVNSSPVFEPDGTPYGALSTYVDVTDRVERERRVRAEADTDELTGLANRRALQRTLQAALTRARAHDLKVGVLMIDLDGFKGVNDRFGHAAGDAALREVAARLRRCVRERDLVARTGGDEFVVVLADLAESDGAAREAAQRIEAAFAEALAPAPLHAAVGVACHPEDGDDLETLLAAADRAMYARKPQ